MSSPYRRQKRHQFWNSATVGTPDDIDLSQLYQKKFDLALDQGTSVATAGSCFAQNIRRELIARHYNFLDTEPSPLMLAEPKRREFGFELFSARYGNIYTTAQLRQLAERAFSDRPGADACWETDGRFYDPFRPTIEPNGFVSREEVEHCRASHLTAVKNLLSQADVLIFTLGLTEAWVSSDDGTVYPLCPGVAAGEFDVSKHKLVNYTTPDVVRDFQTFMEIVATVNPGIRYILTVSPVPLVATATPQHVINATSYSKAVLRAAAGALYNRHDNVDYFPSYEIFTAPAFEGHYYEDDKRSPTQAGITRAMDVFFGQHGEGNPNAAQTGEDPRITEAKRTAAQLQEICDELMLEAEQHAAP